MSQAVNQLRSLTLVCSAIAQLNLIRKFTQKQRPVRSTAQAASHFEKCITVLREIKAENELALAYSGYGRLHKLQGNIEQARDYLTRALEIFVRLGTLIEPDEVRKELAELPLR